MPAPQRHVSRLLALRSLQFTPVVQGAIGDPQVSSDLRDALAAGLHQPHRFQLELFSKRSLFLWHRAPPLLWSNIFQLPLLHKTGASSLGKWEAGSSSS